MKTIEVLTIRSLTRFGYREVANKVVNRYWYKYGDRELAKLLGRRVKHNPYK